MTTPALSTLASRQERAAHLLKLALKQARLNQPAKALNSLEYAINWEGDRQEISRLLVSGSLACLGRETALTLNYVNQANIQTIRRSLAAETSQSGNFSPQINQKTSNKKLFIDCGGHDGCSVIKFLSQFPEYDVVTFEPNPELWSYYKNLTTQLIKKLACHHGGQAEFIIDPVDADGSSIIKEKNVDFYKKIKNEDCPVIVADCQDLSEFVQEQAQNYQEIVLKLDVEGAEYAILEKMLQDGTLKLITKLYAEFHWHKMNFPKEKHDALIKRLGLYLDIKEWDAADFAVHRKVS